MNNTYERIQQRRQYLTKTGWAYAVESISSLLALSLAAIAGILFVFAFVSLLLYCLGYAVPLGTLLLVGTTVLFLGVASFVFAHAARWAYQEATQLSYIPPVNANTLPAEEVLVRGSEEPTQEQSKVLLRRAQCCSGVGDQNLLRSSQRQE